MEQKCDGPKPVLRLNPRIFFRLGRQHPQARYFTGRVKGDGHDHGSVFKGAADVESTRFLVPYDRYALNFNQHPWLRQSGNSEERARRKFAVRKHFAAQLDELVAIPRILDEDCHGH